MTRITTMECPYCTSRLTVTNHMDGRPLSVHHHEPYGEDCEAGIRHQIIEAAHDQDVGLTFIRDI